MKKAVIIYSGGLDSTTCLFWALDEFDEVHTITFYYAQRHSIEVDFSKKTLELAQRIKNKTIKSHYFSIDLSQIGGSALTDPSIDVPKNRDEEKISSEIPITYVPFRNGVFLSITAALAEKNEIYNIIGGWNMLDYSGYPDCRDDFLTAFEKAINYGTKAGSQGKTFKILTPLLKMNKAQIILFGKKHGADYSYSYSCYSGDGIPCGECDACILRAKGFKEAGLEDDFLVRLKREGHNSP
ncbi:7-cyano-7-deazaguanine synthase QueC [Hippea maritima]|uniref:7-cyano-7-deazaguanine synthase n=1 Tax=Hippea maritima (strain ATCC 700847 / DSM 10411 / MH2) TaxID=760142 RepID=F2LX27_HIPMA|nr:7-cyano-7-deazaguanine synthase QueC [Hippea maritima]AEA33085.1 exsB protein [Hippea maritima DSM 10411]